MDLTVAVDHEACEEYTNRLLAEIDGLRALLARPPLALCAPSLQALRANHVAAWERDVHLSDWAVVANTASAVYVPALEDEVDRLTDENRRLRHVAKR